MSRQRWILLGLLSAMIDVCCLSWDAFFNVAHAQTEDLPPKIYVSIPDLAAYWIGQPPILKVVANDDHDPNPRVSAWLNGQLVDVTSPALIENPGIYFLKVEAEDNRFNKSIHSIIFEVLDVPKYQAEITPLWLDYRVDMLSGTVSIEALLLLSNPSFYPQLQIDPHDPRLQNVALCRVSRYSWTMLLTDEDGATVSDPIPLPSEDEAALCDCINQTVFVHFTGNGVCSETPGASIRAQIVTGMRLRAYANGGITNLFPLWAEANVFDSTADTVIGGRCQNAVKNLRVE